MNLNKNYIEALRNIRQVKRSNKPDALIENRLVPDFTVDPSSTKSSVMTPAKGALTGIDVLSVSI